ncbi:NF-kappa-B-activating protein-like [Silurus meridionalis]|uniref:NF-kappa-B-activating protein-like n=1 Tax=Silurus meridionalis TaxID=175797 RepID=UPI001EE9CA1F|nr:NF-kappa-B-activating protein-like [Silurus meridionalis]
MSPACFSYFFRGGGASHVTSSRNAAYDSPRRAERSEAAFVFCPIWATINIKALIIENKKKDCRSVSFLWESRDVQHISNSKDKSSDHKQKTTKKSSKKKKQKQRNERCKSKATDEDSSTEDMESDKGREKTKGKRPVTDTQTEPERKKWKFANEDEFESSEESSEQ